MIPVMNSQELNKIFAEAQEKNIAFEKNLIAIKNDMSKKINIIKYENAFINQKLDVIDTGLIANDKLVSFNNNSYGSFNSYGYMIHPKFKKSPTDIMNLKLPNGDNYFKEGIIAKVNDIEKYNYIDILMADNHFSKSIVFEEFDTPNIKLDTKFNGNFTKDFDKYKEKYNNSRFKSFLENILDEGTILTLQESWGVMLCPNATKVQQCFIYKGEGSNGKSSLFDIQTALLYDKDKSVCGIGLGQFSGDPHIMAMAEGRRINIVRDDTVDGKIGGVFKSAVCGESVTVNKKHKDHVLMCFNMAWFYGLNRMPVTSDKSYGFFRRPIFIPFNVRFGTAEQVKTGEADKVGVPGIVEDIISNEMDIVFMWAYEGLKRLKANNWKVTQSEASIQEMEEYKEEADTAYSFYKNNLVKMPGNKIKASELYTRYEEWCFSEKINNPMSAKEFGRQLASFGHKKKKTSTWYFPDIAYRMFTPVDNIDSPF